MFPRAVAFVKLMYLFVFIPLYVLSHFVCSTMFSLCRLSFVGVGVRGVHHHDGDIRVPGEIDGLKSLNPIADRNAFYFML